MTDDEVIDAIGEAAEPYGMHYPMTWCSVGSRRDQALRRLAAVNEPPRPDDERPRDERGADIESVHATWCSDACCSCDIPF